MPNSTGKIVFSLSDTKSTTDKVGARISLKEKDLLILDRITDNEFEGHKYHELVFQVFRGDNLHRVGEWKVSEKLFFNEYECIEDGSSISFSGDLKANLDDCSSAEEQHLFIGSLSIVKSVKVAKIKPFDKELTRSFANIKLIAYDATEFNGTMPRGNQIIGTRKKLVP